MLGLDGKMERFVLAPVRFNSKQRCAIEPWQGDLWVLKACIPERPWPRDPNLRSELGSLGFKLPAEADLLGGSEGCGAQSLLVDDPWGNEVLRDIAGTALDECEKLEGAGVSRIEEWDVQFPHQLVDACWLEGALGVHELASLLRKRLSQELSVAPLGGGSLRDIAADLRTAIRECDWWEGLLSAYQPAHEAPISLKALSSEIVLRDDEPPAVEQFLQTRTVSLEEAKGELDSWKQPAEDELQALAVTTKAVERVTSRDVEEWVKGSKKVIQVPGKAVLTRKSGIGKRRFRAVCCGNFVPLRVECNEGGFVRRGYRRDYISGSCGVRGTVFTLDRLHLGYQDGLPQCSSAGWRAGRWK